MSEEQAKIKIDGYQRLTLDQLDPDGIDALIRAICERAADDWRWGVRMEQKKRHQISASRLKIDAEHFFLSEHFFILTGLDGAWVLDKLRRDMGL